MPTLWIHTGMPEAGSSTLQGFLAQNETVLRERDNIYIPRTARRPDQELLSHDASFLGADAAALREFIAEIQAAPDCDCIISDERLASSDSGGLNPEHFAAIRQACPQLAIKTLTYLAREDDSIKASFGRKMTALAEGKAESSADAQTLRKCDFNAYLTLLLQKNASGFGTATFIRQSRDILGVENTVLRLFGKKFLHNGNMVDDFLRLLGLDPARDFAKSKARNAAFPLALAPFFMTSGLPPDAPVESRETLCKLAVDTFTRNNTVTAPAVTGSLAAEVTKISEIYSRYTDTLDGKDGKKAAHDYMDLYAGRELNMNAQGLECDRYNLYMIRQLNYVYQEVAQLQAELRDIRQTSILTMLRLGACKCARFLAPAYERVRKAARDCTNRHTQ